MHRVLWFRVGGRRFHLLKLAGAFFVFAFILKSLESAYQIFVTVNKAIYATAKPDLIGQLFGWSIAAPYNFSSEDLLGVLLGPVANFLFWLGLAVVAMIIYQSGKVIVPIEEWAQDVSAHQKHLISKAREAHARMGMRKRK